MAVRSDEEVAHPEEELPLPDSASRVSPYVGLRPISEQESWKLFGRERERGVVASNLVASRLTLLYAPTGVGKSSLIRAGVFPYLEARARDHANVDGAASFFVVVFASWQDDPVAGLVSQIAKTVGISLADRPAALTASTRVRDILREATQARRGDVFVILDQFEEYFLYHRNDDGPDGFAAQLAEAINDEGLRANFLVALREDALAKLDAFKGRIPGLFRNYLRIDYLDLAAATEAVYGPIREYDRLYPDAAVEVEPALVDRVLDRVGLGKVAVGQVGLGVVKPASDEDRKDPIETSHLQIVMARIWDEEARQGSHVLRLSTLEGLGGVKQIVNGHLDEEMRQLSEVQQDIAARAFEHLVTPSGNKIAHTAPDLAGLAKVPEPDLRSVLMRLSESRILRSVASVTGQGEDRYEIFHDVLAPAVLDWRARYLEAKTRAETEQELLRQHHQALRRVRRRALAGVILVVAVALVVAAVILYRSAQHEHAVAESRQEAAAAVSDLSTDPDRSEREALNALDASWTREAELALRRAMAAPHAQAIMAGHTGEVWSVAFDPAGTKVVTASEDGTARIWDVRKGGPPVALKKHKSWVNTAFFDPSGTKVVTASGDGTARVWDADTGQQLAKLHGHTDQVNAASFDPSGTKVVTASGDGTARVWDVGTRRSLVLSGHQGSVNSALFDPTGTKVVTAGEDGTARVWDVATGQELATLNRDGGPVNRAVFSPDGTAVATAGEDGHAYVWDWLTGNVLTLASSGSSSIASIEFNPAGDRVVSAGPRKVAKLWDAKSGALVATFAGHKDWVTAAKFSADGRYVATGSEDGTARVWDVASGLPFIEVRGGAGLVEDVAFSHPKDPGDPQLLATASSDRTARLWTLPRETLMAHPDEVLAAEFSPDGKRVLTSSRDGIARVWGTQRGGQPTLLAGHSGYAIGSFSQDGRLVVTVDKRTVRVWNASGDLRQSIDLPEAESLVRARFMPSGHVVLIADQGGAVYKWNWDGNGSLNRLPTYRNEQLVDFDLSPDGRLFATSSDRFARIWETATGREVHVLRGHGGLVYSARFSRDPHGNRIVTSSGDGTARVWDATTGTPIRTLNAGEGLRTAGFDSTGHMVVTGSVNGVVRVWDERTGNELAVIPKHTDFVDSAAFSPRGSRILTASDDQTARIYSCSTCAALSVLESRAQRDVVVPEKTTSSVSSYALAVGDCYNDLPEGQAQLGAVRIVPCASPHAAEVFGVVVDDAGPEVPFDAKEVGRHADSMCAGNGEHSSLFSKFIGRSYSKSEFQVRRWIPNQGTWDAGDRRIVCEVTAKDGKLSGSARGADR